MTVVIRVGSVTGQAWYRTPTRGLPVVSVIPGMPSTTRPSWVDWYEGRSASVEQCRYPLNS